MIIVISPAKSLNFQKNISIENFSTPEFLSKSEEIMNVLKKKKPTQLMKLMDISENLANLNWQRNQDWKLPFTIENAKPSAFLFDGDVYNGLQIETLQAAQINYLQENVRIFSGLYGLLKPLDLIMPYRLEMGTALAVKSSKNLYDFWKKKITEKLNQEFESHKLLINLASSEYFSVIDKKKIKFRVITPEFKDYKNGQLKMISFFAKKARGMMVRYLAENNITDLESLKNFNYEGYSFDDNLSTQDKLIFTR